MRPGHAAGLRFQRPPRSPPTCRRRAAPGPRPDLRRPRRRARSSSFQTALSPCSRRALEERAARTRTGGRGRRRSGRPRAARRRGRRAARRTVSGVTPGWSPRSSTSTSARGSSAASAAAIEDEQPRRSRVDDDLGAGQVDPRADLVGARRRARTSSWSKRAARARWRARGRAASRRRTGSSCLGCPSRVDPPAASTSPATTSSLSRHGPSVARRTSRGSPRSRIERSPSTSRWSVASPAMTSIPQTGSTAVRPARPALRARVGALGDDLGEDRDRDLGRRARADVEPGGRVDLRRAARRGRRATASTARAALAARDEADVADARPRAPARARAPRRRRARRRSAPRRSLRLDSSGSRDDVVAGRARDVSSARAIGVSPTTTIRGAGRCGSRKISSEPPLRHGLCATTTPSCARSSSPRRPGTSRSSTASPVSSARSGVQPHGGLRADAADEAVDRPVGEHERGVAGAHARRASPRARRSPCTNGTRVARAAAPSAGRDRP